jgi:hypothetical protein
MPHRIRFLALYGWPEDFPLAEHPDFLVRLVEDAQIRPTKVTIAVPGEKRERRRTLYKNSKLLDVVSPFVGYDWIALDDPIDGNFLNVRSHLAFVATRRKYLIAKHHSEFAVEEAASHVRMVCERMTPRYGFLHSEIGAAALSFSSGIASTSLNYETRAKVDALGHSLRRTKEHLSGKLHDVYALNVLSPLHLQRIVQGRPLGAWINSGGRGELRDAAPEVFLWIVPADVRPAVRATLLKEGALLVAT